MSDSTNHGPFATEAEVLALPAVRVLYETYRADTGPGKMPVLLHALIARTCTEAHLEMGPFDTRIVGWLCNWEPSTVAAICTWISRAYCQGQTGGAGGGWTSGTCQ